MTDADNWTVPINDGATDERARIEIDRGFDLTLWFESTDGQTHLAAFSVTPLQACQLGLALLDASREAGQRRARMEAKMARLDRGKPGHDGE